MNNHPIYNQLNEDDSKLLKEYERSMYKSKSVEEIDFALKTTIQRIRREDLLLSNSWLKTLHEGIKRNLPEDEIPMNPLSSYMNRIKLRYSGALFGKGGLDNLVRMGEDPTEPHYEWLIDIDNKINAMLIKDEGLKRSKAFSYFLNVEDNQIDFDTFQILMKNMEDEGYSPSMEKKDYVDWYIRSSKDFKDDNTIDLNKALKMSRTLAAWTEDSNYDSETLSWLARNYDVHPMHEEMLDKWAKETVKKQKELNTESNLEM